ncbi:MAG: hypothetical protein IJY49_06030 [Clostridia bacterium]|nr:hypothetical protein [Clostridia bacterium]
MRKENNEINKSSCPKKERKPLTKNAKIVIIVVASVVLAAILAVSGVFINLALQAPSPDTDGIRQFLLKNEFSFGKVCQKNLVYTGGSVPHLTFEDDTAFQPTVSKIQEVYTSSKSKIPTAGDLTDIDDLTSQLIYGQSFLTETIIIDKPQNIKYKLFQNLKTGVISDSDTLKNYISHETYRVNDFYVAYISYIMDGVVVDDDTYGAGFVFATLIYKEGKQRVLEFATHIVYTYDYVLPEVFAEATIEERDQIAQYYQAIHKEIITEFIESEEGQKYLENWF